MGGSPECPTLQKTFIFKPHKTQIIQTRSEINLGLRFNFGSLLMFSFDVRHPRLTKDILFSEKRVSNVRHSMCIAYLYIETSANPICVLFVFEMPIYFFKVKNF